MTNVHVVYASRHGGTQGIAERITEVMLAEGLEVSCSPANAARDLATADAFVIGSGVYMGSWLDEAVKFIVSGKGTHFDPAVVDAFVEVSPTLRRFSPVSE